MAFGMSIGSGILETHQAPEHHGDRLKLNQNGEFSVFFSPYLLCVMTQMIQF